MDIRSLRVNLIKTNLKYFFFFFFFDSLCLVPCLRAACRWSRTYCELVETEMERVWPLSISSACACVCIYVVFKTILSHPLVAPLSFLSSLSHAYRCSRLGSRRQSTLLSCLNYLLFVPDLSDLVQWTEESSLDNQRWWKILPRHVDGVIAITSVRGTTVNTRQMILNHQRITTNVYCDINIICSLLVDCIENVQ